MLLLKHTGRAKKQREILHVTDAIGMQNSSKKPSFTPFCCVSTQRATGKYAAKGGMQTITDGEWSGVHHYAVRLTAPDFLLTVACIGFPLWTINP